MLYRFTLAESLGGERGHGQMGRGNGRWAMGGWAMGGWADGRTGQIWLIEELAH